ncbi:hypothetical protein QUA94_35185 [Microcoleus sp. F8-D2]|jgi:hypothetical protein
MPTKRRHGVPERVLLGVARDQIDTTTWEPLDEGALPEKHLKLYKARKAGIEAYLRGASTRKIKEVSGFSRVHIYRLLTERCLVIYKDGLPAGWRGLKPHERLVPYTRTAPLAPDPWGAGTSGALQLLFSTKGGHDLRVRFENRILRKTAGINYLSSNRLAKQELIVWFLREARNLFEVPEENWPFNREKQGRVTLSKFIDQVLEQHPRRALELEGGPEAVKKAKAGDGVDRPQFRLLERVESDAHKLDIRCVINVPNPAGGWEAHLVHRIWVVVAEEVPSRCVLGYSISLRKEVSKEDVLRMLRHALQRWEPRQSSLVKDHKYNPKSGFPSKLDPRFIGACWNSMSVDGAMVNACKTVRGILKTVVGAELITPLAEDKSYAQRRSMDDRPYIETFFRNFSKPMTRLAPGTGASPKERKGRDPEGAAVKSNFQLEYLEDLLDILVANYNGTPHSKLGYRSPLEQFAFLASQEPDLLRTADPGEVSRLLSARKLCRVISSHSGARVHINFGNAEYSAEWLKSRRDLFSEYVEIYLEDDHDARFVTVSHRGQILGTLRAAPPWHQSPHTLYMRSAIKTLHKKRIIHLTSLDDPIVQLCEQAEKSPGGKLKVHPAYLEARRVFAHIAAQASLSSNILGGTASPAVAQETQGFPAHDHQANERSRTTESAPVNREVTRRKAINTGQKR